jgi:Xaa-Pro aminopeptidase
MSRDRPEIVFFDWTRHDAYVATRVLCDEIVLFDYGSPPQKVAAAFVERGWTGRVVAIEWCSPNPAAPVMSELAGLLEQAGASLATGDWIVDQVRLYKSAAEVDRIRRAAAMADSAMSQLQKDLKPGMTELAVSAHLSSLLAQRPWLFIFHRIDGAVSKYEVG